MKTQYGGSKPYAIRYDTHSFLYVTKRTNDRIEYVRLRKRKHLQKEKENSKTNRLYTRLTNDELLVKLENMLILLLSKIAFTVHVHSLNKYTSRTAIYTALYIELVNIDVVNASAILADQTLYPHCSALFHCTLHNTL